MWDFWHILTSSYSLLTKIDIWKPPFSLDCLRSLWNAPKQFYCRKKFVKSTVFLAQPCRNFWVILLDWLRNQLLHKLPSISSRLELVRPLLVNNQLSDHDFCKFTHIDTALDCPKCVPKCEWSQFWGWYFRDDSFSCHVPNFQGLIIYSHSLARYHI